MYIDATLIFATHIKYNKIPPSSHSKIPEEFSKVFPFYFPFFELLLFFHLSQQQQPLLKNDCYQKSPPACSPTHTTKCNFFPFFLDWIPLNIHSSEFRCRRQCWNGKFLFCEFSTPVFLPHPTHCFRVRLDVTWLECRIARLSVGNIIVFSRLYRDSTW